MLTSVKIKSLFGLYSYELDFSNRINFVTGPNGFGKTTILNLIEALYSCNFKYISGVVFDYFEATISNKTKTVISIQQIREYDEIDDGSDEPRSLKDVHLDICMVQDDVVISKFRYGTSDNEAQSSGDIMQLYMSSLHLTPIRANRCAYSQSDTSQVNNVVKDINKQISLCKEIIANELSQILAPIVGKAISEDDYNNEYNNICQELHKLAEYGFIGNTKQAYSDANSGFLSTYIQVLKNIVNASRIVINKLNVLQEIVEKCEYSNKILSIKADSGIRFIAKNETKSILYFEQLSSGEQQVLLLFYELLFKSDIDSLVLIDEPELSLHIAWKYLFIENIQNIIGANPQQQYIIFTHSPSIINNHWDCTKDLFEINTNK